MPNPDADLICCMLYVAVCLVDVHACLNPTALKCMCPAGAQYTGASLNPARTLGPAFVYHRQWRYAWVYVLAEILGQSSV